MSADIFSGSFSGIMSIKELIRFLDNNIIADKYQCVLRENFSVIIVCIKKKKCFSVFSAGVSV